MNKPVSSVTAIQALPTGTTQPLQTLRMTADDVIASAAMPLADNLQSRGAVDSMQNQTANSAASRRRASISETVNSSISQAMKSNISTGNSLTSPDDDPEVDPSNVVGPATSVGSNNPALQRTSAGPISSSANGLSHQGQSSLSNGQKRDASGSGQKNMASTNQTLTSVSSPSRPQVPIDPELGKNGFLMDRQPPENGSKDSDSAAITQSLLKEDHSNVQFSQLSTRHTNRAQQQAKNSSGASANFADPFSYNAHHDPQTAADHAVSAIVGGNNAHAKTHPLSLSQDPSSTSTPVHHYSGIMQGRNFMGDNSPRPRDFHQSEGSSMLIDNKDVSSLSNGTSSTSGTKKRKAGALNEFNEDDLNMPLEELADKVRDQEPGNSTSSVAEKNRQLFGLAWLQKFCQLSPEANVPRNRIYARYVSLCSSYNLRPLNPASFGKLVRTKFPQIRTRRLGIRGQSKYHYCGVSLVDELNQPSGETPVGTPGRYSADTPDSFVSLRPQLLNTSADYSALSNSPYTPSNGAGHNISVVGQESPGDDTNRLGTPSSTNRLEFMHDISQMDGLSVPLASSGGEFSIPSLEPYLPTDYYANPDDVATLSALYKSYCQSLMEYLRFMQFGKLFKTIQTFIGGLTTPVQRLLSQESVTRWVARNDWLLYKEMIYLLNRLIFDEIPPKVSQQLRTLAQSLPSRIRDSLATNNMPQYLIDSKLTSAQAFVCVVDRMLRANDAGIHAGRILSNVNEVEKMKKDWAEYVNGRAIAEREVPCEALRVSKILDKEIPGLLSVLPIPVPSSAIRQQENPTVGAASTPNVSRTKTGDTLLGNDIYLQFKGNEEEETSNNDKTRDQDVNKASITGDCGKSESPLDVNNGSQLDMTGYEYPTELLRWAEYLSRLPGIFPTIPPRVFLLCVSTVLTCALRDISVNGGEGFGAWWVVRMWIDEWLGWRAEMGGFLARPDRDVNNIGAEQTAGMVDLFINGADALNFRLFFPNAGAQYPSASHQAEAAGEIQEDHDAS